MAKLNPLELHDLYQAKHTIGTAMSAILSRRLLNPNMTLEDAFQLLEDMLKSFRDEIHENVALQTKDQNDAA